MIKTRVKSHCFFGVSKNLDLSVLLHYLAWVLLHSGTSFPGLAAHWGFGWKEQISSLMDPYLTHMNTLASIAAWNC